MKTLVNTILFIGSIIIGGKASAQKESKSSETIILQDNKPTSQIQIEIKDGDVYVDGKKVAPYNLNRNLKIIKKLGKAFSNETMPDIELNLPKDQFDVIGSNKAMLGVSTTPSTTNNGVVIAEVNANTPADKAQLKEGDIITKIDQLPITSPQDLVNAIGNYKPGDKINLQITRDGKEIKKEIMLQESNDDFSFLRGGDGQDMFGGFEQIMKQFQNLDQFKNFDGMEGLQQLDIMEDRNGEPFSYYSYGNKIPNNNEPKLGAKVEDRADNNGVRVLSVSKNSPADKAGMLENDIIVNYAGTPIKNIDHLTNAIVDAKNIAQIVVEVIRNEKSKTLYVDMPKTLRKKDF